jgi:beta-galactosidase/beta-glucuronidase
VIDSGWKFRTDPSNSGESQGWGKAIPPGAAPIAIPSLWTTVAAPGYSGVAWYWLEVDPPGKWLGQTVRLRFEAAADRTVVWVNGERAGDHTGGAVPFELNITKALKIGTRNLLAVRAEGEASRGAGLWQGVLLLASDEAFISDVFPHGGPLGNLVAEVELTNTSDKSGDCSLDARVIAANAPDKTIKSSSQNLSLTPNRNLTTMLINVPKKNLSAWSPDSPALYHVDLSFHQDKDVLDTTETTFGFRDLGWIDSAITINGTAIVPRAVAPDNALPIVIATEPDRSAAKAMLQRLKDAHVTVVYLDAPPPALLSLADEMGLLVVEGPRRRLPQAGAEQELLDLVRRDRAHPSVIGWNVRDLGAAVVSKIKLLDRTRFVLAGVGKEARLWPPHSESTASPPPGLGVTP